MTDPFKCMKWLERQSNNNVIPLHYVLRELNMRLEYLQFIMKRWPNRYDEFSNVHDTIKRIGIDIARMCFVNPGVSAELRPEWYGSSKRSRRCSQTPELYPIFGLRLKMQKTILLTTWECHLFRGM